MRALVLSAAALAALAGCEPSVPDSAAGVGFESYGNYLKTHSVPTGGATSAVPPANAAPTAGVSTTPLAANGAPAPGANTGAGTGATTTAQSDTGLFDPNRPRGDAPNTIAATTAEMTTVPDRPGISDEQDFAAVSSRETIESDKERLARQREQYQVIPPQPVPERTSTEGPNIVRYALNATNPVGQPIYSRINPFRNSMSERACAKFPSADKAQEAFLAAGGPERDPKSLDPDGDGYACSWDPTPFRAALK